MATRRKDPRVKLAEAAAEIGVDRAIELLQFAKNSQPKPEKEQPGRRSVQSRTDKGIDKDKPKGTE
jgi:hypothetical protein